MALPRAGAAAGKSRPDRVLGIDQIVEACARAERENMPLCFCLLQAGTPVHHSEDFPGMETAWNTAISQLSAECIVVEARQSHPQWSFFAKLKLRTQAALPAFAFTGMGLTDPWQEKSLGSARIDPCDWTDAEKKRKTLPKFKEDVAKLVKAAAAWNAANAPKPVPWTDVKGRTMTAVALSWDGKTAVFRLPAGKNVSLPAATLSPDSLTRLAAVFPPVLPLLDAADEKALEAHVGQEVCVIGREETLKILGEIAVKPGDLTTCNLSALFGLKYDDAMRDIFGAAHPDGGWPARRQSVTGLLQKETEPKKHWKYFILIKEPRKVGPGPMPR